jgi:hypothetical protein
MKNEKILNWLECSGGPFILMEKSLLKYWGGYDEEGEPNDYDRACEINEYLGIVNVHDGVALIVNTESMQIAINPSIKTNEIMFISWVYANNEQDIINSLKEIPEYIWDNINIKIQIINGDLVLFESVNPGNDVEEYFNILLEKGNYCVLSGVYNPNKSTRFILYKLIKLD